MILRASNFKFDGWNAGLNCSHASRGACYVLFLADARISAKLCEPQRLALVRKASLSNRKLPLRAPQFEIIARQLGNDAHLHVSKIGFRRLIVGSSRGHVVSHSAKKIRFPKGVKSRTERVNHLPLISKTGNLLLGVLIGPVHRYRGHAIQFPLIEDGARFREPGPRDANGIVRGEGAIHKGIEHGILKLTPPARVQWRLREKIPIHSTEFHSRRLWRLVMRPEGAACEESARS